MPPSASGTSSVAPDREVLGYELTLWCAILAPAGAPAAIVMKGYGEVARILQLPDLKGHFVA